jgi:hypothetical protein
MKRLFQVGQFFCIFALANEVGETLNERQQDHCLLRHIGEVIAQLLVTVAFGLWGKRDTRQVFDLIFIR